ncbi:MAG: hypothetical protein WB586_03615 [Chthoniobacterales bacterium]
MRILAQPLTLAVLCAILTLLMGFFAGLKIKQDADNRELARQKAAWAAAIKQDLKALPDSFSTPRWQDQKNSQ